MKRYSKMLLFLTASSILFSAAAEAVMSTKTTIPEFSEGSWMNSSRMTRKMLENKVSLIYFWNASDFESLNNFAFLKYLHYHYDALNFQIIAIHSPRYDFEKGPEYSKRAADHLKAAIPIFTDDDKLMRTVYEAQKIPSFYLIDHKLRVRTIFHTQYRYEDINLALQQLLKEISDLHFGKFYDDFSRIAVFPAGHPPLITAYENLSGYGNIDRIRVDESKTFQNTEYVQPHLFYLNGDWIIKKEYVENYRPRARIAIKSSHRGLSMLAGAPLNSAGNAQILLNGEVLTGKTTGRDVILKDGKSFISIHEKRLYNLLDIVEGQKMNRIDLIFEDSSLRIWNFQFADLPVLFDIQEKEESKSSQKVKLSGELVSEQPAESL